MWRASLRAGAFGAPLRRVPLRRWAHSGSGPTHKTHRTRWIVLGAFGLAGISLYLTSEPTRKGVDFAAHVIQRSSSVSVAVSRIVWRYRKTLSKNYATAEDYDRALRNCHAECALIARAVLEKNAGIYIKLGQHIAAMNYVLPEEWTTAMIPLQDKCPVSSYESVKGLFESDEGKSIEELFSEFDPVPMGTASLAQVHRARLHSGEEVAVKVQHPSLATYVPLDVAMVDAVTTIAGYFFPEYPLKWLSDEMQQSIYVELDFRDEAKNARHTAEYFEKYYNETHLRIPHVFWARKRLLCMEFLQGIRPDDLPALDKAGVSRHKLATCLSHLFDNMIFTPGVGLHCDPHAGNIAIRPLAKGNFEIILYDHGLYRYVPTETRRAYAHLWLALIDGDKPGMQKYAEEFAHIDGKQFNIFAAAITGRDFDSAVNNVVSRRDPKESAKMAQAVQDQGLLGDIMRMLAQMPNVVLLIFKTNDLVRYLDEQLDTPMGVIGSFMIMAHYCAMTVLDEDLERIRKRYLTSPWSPKRLLLMLGAEFKFWRREAQLYLYTFYGYWLKG